MSRHGVIAAVGTFDGVHCGHRYLIDHLCREARERCMGTRIYTFTDTPLAYLAPQRAPRLLTTSTEKAALLATTGIDEFRMDRFESVATLTARQYIEQLALEGVKVLLIGYDNRFGCDRLTTLQEFKHAAEGTGVEIIQSNELTDTAGNPINSSAIRTALATGDLGHANDMLGYEYNVTGIVVHGKQLGRTIGFPTANVEVPIKSHKLIPCNGVYACRAHVDGELYKAMVNVGHRPTVDGDASPVNIEAHLMECDDDLYDCDLTLDFVARLRYEQRFGSVDELALQLARDRDAACSILELVE